VTPSRPEKRRRWSLYPQRQLAVQWTSPDGLSCLGDVAALRSGTARRSALASRTSYPHRFGPSGRLRAGGGGWWWWPASNVAFASRIPRPPCEQALVSQCRAQGWGQPAPFLAYTHHPDTNHTKIHCGSLRGGTPDSRIRNLSPFISSTLGLWSEAEQTSASAARTWAHWGGVCGTCGACLCAANGVDKGIALVGKSCRGFASGTGSAPRDLMDGVASYP